METIHWVCAHGHHGAGDHLPEQCPLGWCQEQVHRTRPVPA